ncbi:MAG: DUF192 domain-containing protein, partial [Bradymonadaceae bacterium]
MTLWKVGKFVLWSVGRLVAAFVVFVSKAQTGFLPVVAGEFDEVSARVTDCAGTQKGELERGVVRSFSQGYVGLSRQESIAPNGGLVFPYREQYSHRIEMRNMDFGLDILFVRADGTIGTLETLDAPDSLLEYYLTYDSTYAPSKYVVEIAAGWSDEHGVSTGDCVEG